MKMMRALALAASTMLAANAVNAATVTLDFGGSSAASSTKTFMNGGVSVTAEAARVLLGLWVFDGRVTQTASGLGVTSGGILPDSDGQIDGLGLNDILVLTFDQVVRDVATFFQSIDSNGSDDWDIYVDNGSGTFSQIFNDSNTNNLLAGGLIKRIAYVADASNDDFRVRSVTVSTVPLPAAGWLLVAGIGGLVLLRRRQHA